MTHPCCPNPIVFPQNVLVPKVPTSQSTCNLSPMYPVPSGQVGEIIVGTVTNLTYPVIDVPTQMATISLPKGVWIVTSNLTSNPYGSYGGFGGYGINSIGPNASNFTNEFATSNFVVYGGYTLQSTVSGPVSINTTTNYYVNYQSNYPGPIGSVVFNAVRIA